MSDDDDVQETNVLVSDNASQPKHATVEHEAPAKPPRPLSPQQQAENTLKEAFPSIDAAVVKAVLRASGGQVEPAFNALLGRKHDHIPLGEILMAYRDVRSNCRHRTNTPCPTTATKTGTTSATWRINYTITTRGR